MQWTKKNLKPLYNNFNKINEPHYVILINALIFETLTELFI